MKGCLSNQGTLRAGIVDQIILGYSEALKQSENKI
jgi:hypothetical protein